MSHYLATLLTFVAASLLVLAVGRLFGDVFLRYWRDVDDRVDELTGKAQSTANTSLFKDLRQLSLAASAAQPSYSDRMRAAIEQAGMNVSLGTLLTASLITGCLLGVVVAVSSHRWWATLLVVLLGFLLPALYVGWRRKKRMRRLALQLPEAFDVIGRAVRSGQTVPAALQIIAEDFEEPIRDELRRCCDEQNLGMPYDTALRNLARRTGIMELRILVVALLVQSRCGGNLVELLNHLAGMVRNRIKLEQKVKALTGEGRMQAAVLIVLPILAFAGLMVLSPDYIGALIARPWLIATTATAQLVGAIWIRRIVSVDF